jgi:phosphate transport system permease protein
MSSNGFTLEQLSVGRRVRNAAAIWAATLSAIIVISPLLVIFAYLLIRGLGSVNLAFLTRAPVPVGETGGGVGNAIVGSAIILAIASLIGVPLGIGAGIYLSEYGRNQFGNAVRFTADILNGLPSIVIGIAIYGLVVAPMKHFSAFAGGVALGVMMVPTVARTTEEILLMVPNTIREAALGLGIPQWRSTISITLRTATSGVITGVMLAFARVAGETAPLIFTAFGNQFWSFKVNQPIAALPLMIYTYAQSPYEEWHRIAWAGSLVLIVIIVGTFAVVRLVASRGLLKGTA